VVVPRFIVAITPPVEWLPLCLSLSDDIWIDVSICRGYHHVESLSYRIFKTIDVYSMDPEVAALWGAPTTTSNCRLAGLCDRTSGPVFVDSFSFGLCGSHALRLLLSYLYEMKRTWTETTRLEWTRRRDTYRERKQLPPLEQLRTSDDPKDRKAYEGALSAERRCLSDRLDAHSTKAVAWPVSRPSYYLLR
jgi:hypothetical protein